MLHSTEVGTLDWIIFQSEYFRKMNEHQVKQKGQPELLTRGMNSAQVGDCICPLWGQLLSTPPFKQIPIICPSVCLRLQWDLSPPSESCLATVARKMLPLQLTFQRLEITAGCFLAADEIRFAQRGVMEKHRNAQIATTRRGCWGRWVRWGYQETFGYCLPFLETWERKRIVTKSIQWTFLLLQ